MNLSITNTCFHKYGVYNTSIKNSEPPEKQCHKPQEKLYGQHLNHIQPLTFGFYFAFKEQENLPCPCCGKIMTTNEEITNFANNMEYATGKNLISGLKKYMDRLPNTEKAVSIRLIDAANENENLELNQLLNRMLNEPKQKLEKTQREILAEISELANSLKGETHEEIQKDIRALKIIIAEGKNGSPFKRKTMINGFEKLLEKYKETIPENIPALEEIVKKAQNMPTSGTDINAFIVKYSRRNSYEIAHRLLEPSIATAEHIKPRSKDGDDDPKNYLAECKKCNNDRENMSYVEWLKIHPEMIENTQKHMDEIIDRIINGKIKGFDNYPQSAKEALYKESQGLIDIDISKMIEYRKTKLRNYGPNDLSTRLKINSFA